MGKDLIEHWVWLQQSLGANSAKAERLLDDFGSVAGVYEAGRADYMESGPFTEKELRGLCDKSLEESKKTVGRCIEKGYGILTLPDMPKRLRNIYAPPCVLYVFGKLPQPTDGVYISMVGTRGATPYGIEAATKLALGLSRCGAVVVSGLALGIDAASHKGALKGGGKTVAVMGCGIDIDYPAQNTELKRLIAKNGAVVSEYPPGTRPGKANFPIRNRIIAGLSLGCIVVEAGRRSGALITASLAAEMGRDVFAVPGSIFSPQSDGANRLLRDGAKPACSVMDILEEYIGPYPQSIFLPPAFVYGNVQSPKAKEGKNPGPVQTTLYPQTSPDCLKGAAERGQGEKSGAAGLSETQTRVLGVLTDEPQHVDDISLRANLELRIVLAVLTTLEIEGYVQSFPGRRYTLMK